MSQRRFAAHRILLVSALVAGLWTATFPSAAARSAPDGDVIRSWTSVAFDTVRQTGGSDAAAARLYAMVDVAMFDAVNGLSPHPRSSALVPPSTAKSGDPIAAAATAAHDVLVALYPARAATYDSHLADDLASGTSPGQLKHGREWGAEVAAAVVSARANDGSSGAEPQGGVVAPGQFRTSWDAHYRHLQPFAITDPSRYVGPPPPPLNSAEYAVAFNDVKLHGSNAPDSAAAATFDFWKLSAGTNQPAGAWLQVAQTVSASRGLSLEDTAQLFALESMALADVVAPTNETKYQFHYWRPETAIREANPAVNPQTIPEPAWKGRGSVSGTPEHFSGHSSFSGAGAEVLARFFHDDDVPVTLRTDSGGGATRSYQSFSAIAAEAGRSRVLGGQHFEFSNEDGLRSGRLVADEVVERLCNAC